MEEEPGLKEDNWILDEKWKTDTKGLVTITMGGREGLERAFARPWAPRQFLVASGLACEHGIRGPEKEWKLRGQDLLVTEHRAGSMRRVNNRN